MLSNNANVREIISCKHLESKKNIAIRQGTVLCLGNEGMD